jgi:hypothetical protein
MNNDVLKPKVIKPASEPSIPPEEPKPVDSSLAEPPSEPVKAVEAVAPTTPPKKKRKGFKQWFSGLSKKQRVLFFLVLFLVIGGLSAGAVFALNNKKATAPAAVVVVEKKEEPPKPTTEASRLTGVQIEPALNKRPVIGIMIENSPDARPQSALNQAGVVFEAVAEGGITRFLALFQEAQPDYIGPVRSVRPYYLDWVQGFDAAIVHAGGSADGLAKIRAEKIKDIDHGANGSTFSRVSSRYAPHNLYTTTAKLDEAATRRGYTTSTFEGFPRKAEKAIAVPTAKAIDLTMSSYLYNAHYDYDATTNAYKRSEGGKPHVDEKSGAQISPKVVIAMVMQYSQRGIYSVYNANGTGKVYIFQDGGMTEGTWTKTSSKTQVTFKDATGNPIKLDPGQTWITAVSGAEKVKFTP